MNRKGLANLHVLNSLIEAGDHLASAASEVERSTMVERRIELGAVVKRAGVVDKKPSCHRCS